MNRRIEIPANTPWAKSLSYSRAVALGGFVFVSGTLPVDDGGALVGNDSAYEQARHVLQVISTALEGAGATFGDVVRLRIYLRDYADLAEVARAQVEAFGHQKPACTVLRSDLVRVEFRVQMDADALLAKTA